MPTKQSRRGRSSPLQLAPPLRRRRAPSARWTPHSLIKSTLLPLKPPLFFRSWSSRTISMSSSLHFTVRASESVVLIVVAVTRSMHWTGCNIVLRHPGSSSTRTPPVAARTFPQPRRLNRVTARAAQSLIPTRAYQQGHRSAGCEARRCKPFTRKAGTQ